MFHQVRETIPAEKKPVTADIIGGTYEEMYSNWRNKMYLAASTGNRHLAFKIGGASCRERVFCWV